MVSKDTIRGVKYMNSPKTPRSKRQANDRWDYENMITLGCKVKRDIALLFKEYAQMQNTTANALLKEYVEKCVSEYLNSTETDERNE